MGSISWKGLRLCRRWLRGGSLMKREQSLFKDVFFHCLKYTKKERKRVKIGKIRKHVLFESPHANFNMAHEFLKFISRG